MAAALDENDKFLRTAENDCVYVEEREIIDLDR